MELTRGDDTLDRRWPLIIRFIYLIHVKGGQQNATDDFHLFRSIVIQFEGFFSPESYTWPLVDSVHFRYCGDCIRVDYGDDHSHL